MTTRRTFLAGILAAGAAPAFVKAGVLMPVRKIIVPGDELKHFYATPGRVWVRYWPERLSDDALAAEFSPMGGVKLSSLRDPQELLSAKGMLISSDDRTTLTIVQPRGRPRHHRFDISAFQIDRS